MSDLSTATGKKPKRVIIAFGAALCYTGYGYAPTPQRELRKRLQMRGFTLALIDEPYTSKKCGVCHEDLAPVYARRSNGEKFDTYKWRDCVNSCCARNKDKTGSPNHEQQKFCFTSLKRRVHRDKNADISMTEILLYLVYSDERPEGVPTWHFAQVSVSPELIEERKRLRKEWQGDSAQKARLIQRYSNPRVEEDAQA